MPKAFSTTRLAREKLKKFNKKHRIIFSALESLLDEKKIKLLAVIKKLNNVNLIANVDPCFNCNLKERGFLC
jgi:hypothetical protein